MNDIIIKISDNLIVENLFFSKRIFINDEYFGKTKSDEIQLKKNFDTMDIRIEILGGYYSLNIHLPESENKSYVIYLEDKYSNIFQIIFLLTILITILFLFFHIVSVAFCHLLFWGVFLSLILFDVIIRKKNIK